MNMRELLSEGSRRRDPRFVGLQEGANGGFVPVYRVPAWRKPNEDGSNRDAMYRPYRGSAPHFWDGHFRRADQMTAAEIRDLLGL